MILFSNAGSIVFDRNSFVDVKGKVDVKWEGFFSSVCDLYHGELDEI